MIGLPEFKTRVRIWPYPGRLVQDGPRPVDRVGGGSWLPKKGKVVEWTPFHLEQLRHGDLLLHFPPCEKHTFPEGVDECQECGRTAKEAAEYDAHHLPALARHRALAQSKPAEPPKEYSHAAASDAHMDAAHPDWNKAEPASQSPPTPVAKTDAASPADPAPFERTVSSAQDLSSIDPEKR